MNNIMAIDYAQRDNCDDTDLLLSRYCMEYPRLAYNFKSKRDLPPYGKHQPIQVEHEIDENLKYFSPSYKPGRYYFGSTFFREHAQLVGIPIVWRLL